MSCRGDQAIHQPLMERWMLARLTGKAAQWAVRKQKVVRSASRIAIWMRWFCTSVTIQTWFLSCNLVRSQDIGRPKTSWEIFLRWVFQLISTIQTRICKNLRPRCAPCRDNRSVDFASPRLYISGNFQLLNKFGSRLCRYETRISI